MKQTWKKISSLFLVVCMILTMLPMTSYGAGIDRPQVYFGKNINGNPIKWYIVATATDASSVTLWTADSMGSKAYDSSEHANWSGSEICTWLNSTFLDDAFTAAEQKLIAAYGSTEDPNSIDISQKMVLPSVEEMGTGSSAGTWNINESARSLSDSWWLRTPGASDTAAAYVKFDGEVIVDGDVVSKTLAVCPAFKVDVSSALFATAAANGKSTSIGSLARVTAPSGAMKCTIIDSAMATPSLTLAAETNGTNAIQFAYSGAQTGTNQYLSCVLQQSNTLEYYGKLADCDSNPSGNCTFSISGVKHGTYDLQIFCEQVNDDYFSDYASAPVGTMTLTVDANGKGTVSGTGFSSDDSTSPVLSAGSVNRTSDTEGTIDFFSDEAGEAYYAVAEKDVAAPEKADIVSNGNPLGSVNGMATGKAIDLSAGAKDIYVVVKDAAGNISSPLKIEAAAYATTDSIAPMLSASSVNRTSDTEGTIGFTTDEAGEAYYVVVDKDAAAPDKADIISGGTSLGSVSGTVTSKAVILTAGAKDIYVVVKDVAKNLSDPLKIEAAAYVPIDTAPILSAGSVSRTGDTAATIGFTTNEVGEAYYAVAEKDVAAPDKADIVSSGTSLGLVSGTVTGKAVDLSAGAKDIYVVVKDVVGNISSPLKIETAAYVLPNTDVDTVGKSNDGVNFTSLLSGGGKVYYGSYRHILEPFHRSGTSYYSTWEAQATPVLWRIMGEEPGSPDHGITLMSHYIVNCGKFGKSGESSGWEGSYAQAFLNTTFSYSADAVFLLRSFTTPETEHILTTTGLSAKVVPGGEIKQFSGCKLWLPESNNHNQSFGGTSDVTWYANVETSPTVQLGTSVSDNIATLKCGTVSSYWLRSPIEDGAYVENQVTGYGYTDSACNVEGYNGIRPLCKLDPQAVLFASEILSDVTNKPWATATVANNYATGDDTAKNYKLTILNSALQIGTLSLNGGDLQNGSTNAIELGTNLDITATGASADTKLTYKIVTAEGGERQVVGYGYGDNTSLTLETKDLSGADLSRGDYDVYVWAQKDNAINSNEGSTPLYFKVCLDTPHDVNVTNGTGSGSYVRGGTITITPAPAPGGKQFKEWSITPDVIFVDGTSKSSQTAKFTMPAEIVTATANYETISATYTGVTVNPPTVTVQKGKTYHFGAIVNGAYNPSQAITWTVEGGNGTTAIGTDGKLTIAPNETAATLTVRATSVADTSKSGIATVTVIQSQPSYTYTVTFMNGSTVYATKTVVSPATAIDTLPMNPTNGSYTFRGWFTGAGGRGTGFNASTSVTSNMTVYAYWTGGGGSSSSGGGAAPSVPKQEANVTGGGSAIKTEIKTNTKAGSASAELTATQVAKNKDISVAIPKITGVSKYSLGIPEASLSSIGGNGSVTLNTAVGNITLPSNMLAGTSTASGNQAQIHIGVVKFSDLPKDAQDKVGNHPIVSLELSIDGKTAAWNNPNAPVMVSIPYTPTAEELKNPKQIIAWYIDGSGNLIKMKDAKYDPATKCVVFTTTHFSYYAVGYNTSALSEKFSDVLSDAWYNDAVTFISEKGITTGTGDGKFSPDATLTRGQFIVMLMKAYGIQEDKNATANFTDAGNTYYTGYLAAAKAKGILSGLGDNKFGPEQAITRQEMFTLLYNAQKVIGQIPQGDSGKTVSDFSDASQIANWARESITTFIGTGAISGNDGKIQPLSTTTRAEMAQVLYNLLAE
ncbi:S-layer homology domain-containing protein [Anaerotignum propionicum]|uniref:S-layer homology domain-containing protein n=1 Tax=Anaerotignum propionicum TaxID=28446 RepID=UPI00210CB635|nr:S-layer homology domain-containing protein [Anaerotignum propionicum]MCQ4936386.1 S-layer homology domain-containing protein [Anaerotignum propionicum]